MHLLCLFIGDRFPESHSFFWEWLPVESLICDGRAHFLSTFSFCIDKQHCIQMHTLGSLSVWRLWYFAMQTYHGRLGCGRNKCLLCFSTGRLLSVCEQNLPTTMLWISVECGAADLQQSNKSWCMHSVIACMTSSMYCCKHSTSHACSGMFLRMEVCRSAAWQQLATSVDRGMPIRDEGYNLAVTWAGTYSRQLRQLQPVPL